MPPLSIPREYRSGLAKLQNLSENVVDELVGVLRQAPVRFYRRDLTEAIKGKIASLNDEDLRDIVDALASMEFARVAADMSLDAFMKKLDAAFSREGLSAKNVDNTPTVDRIRQLLQVPSLGIPAKARALLLEGKTLCRARVITDVRPVYDAAEVPGPPEAALIVHNLRISYHDGSRAVHDFVVALDSNDLDELIAVLTRAKVKEQTLETLLKTAKTPFLKVE